MLQHVMPLQVKVFDDYDPNALDKMNDFIWDHDVVDIKMNTVCHQTGNFYTKYLVLYRVRVLKDEK